MKPKVTVLMPVYNGEKYIAEAIESILNQSFKDFEFLIINDGSTDGSRKIIESYSDSRIRLINQNNQGLSTSLNTGIDLSLGEYIVRMDADDISLTNRLKEQVNFMDTNKEVGICGTYAIIINKNGKNIGRMVYPLKHEEIKAQLLFSSSLAHPSVIFRKSVLQINNLKYLNVKSEDYDLWIRSTEFTKLANIGRFLIKYRFGVGISENLYKEDYISSTNQIIKKNLINLGNFSDLEIHIYEQMYNSYVIPDNNFLKKSYEILEKIRLINKNTNIYQITALDLVIIIKWFYICARMSKVKILISLEFWLYSVIFFCRLSFKNKLSLFKIIKAKLIF